MYPSTFDPNNYPSLYHSLVDKQNSSDKRAAEETSPAFLIKNERGNGEGMNLADMVLRHDTVETFLVQRAITPRPSSAALQKLANVANTDNGVLVTAAEMEAALNFVEWNSDKLESALQEIINIERNPYLVIPKSVSGLAHNLEYHGKGLVLLRFHKDFTNGTTKVCSKMVDLYGNQLLAKKKIVIDETQNLTLANLYRAIRNESVKGPSRPKEYVTGALTWATAKNEAAKGRGLSSVLQNLHFAVYYKTATSLGMTATIHKAAMYSLLQSGSVSSKAFHDEEKHTVSIQIITHVHALHSEGICHNDVKGQNLLWTRVNGVIVTILTDLGLASAIESSENYLFGYKECCPPELLEMFLGIPSKEFLALSQTDRNKAKDCFATGVTLLELYGYIPPWKADVDRDDIGQAIQTMNEPQKMDLSKMPAVLQAIARGLLNPNPVTRMKTSEALSLLAQANSNSAFSQHFRPLSIAEKIK